VEEIILKSNIITVEKINRRSQAKMFKDLKVGDQIEFSVPLKSAGRGSRGSYATYIIVKNINTGDTTSSSFNQLPNILKAFKFKVGVDING
jgi:ribosomal protein L19